MVCTNFSKLSPREKVIFIGELTHACMNDSEMYEMGVSLIQIATARGIFDNVKIMPESDNTETEATE